MVVEKGNLVRVEYEGSFDNGEVFDSSVNHGKPLEFKAGEGMVVLGFDNAIIGMEVGEEKTIKISPDQGYGEINPQAIQKVPKDNFPEEAKEGMMIGVSLPNGQQIPAKIIKIEDGGVTLDLNHPLAGKTLNFKIKLLEIVK